MSAPMNVIMRAIEPKLHHHPMLQAFLLAARCEGFVFALQQ